MSTPQDKLGFLSPAENPIQQANPLLEQPVGFVSPSQMNFNTLRSPSEDLQPKSGYGAAILSAIAPVVDVLARPQYASAKFFDSVGNESKGIFESLGSAFNEFISPKQRLSFSDVITKAAPTWARENPTSTKVLGFLADIALDPTTYLGVGFATDGIKIGSKIASEAGLAAVKGGVKTIGKEAFAKEGLLDLIEGIGKETVKKRPNINKIALFTDELNKGGYFQEVINRSKNVEEFASSIGATTDQAVIKGIATDEILSDLKRGIATKSNAFTGQEIRETVEQRILRLSETDTKLAETLFQPKGGPKLTLGIPFTKAEVAVPYSEEAIRYLGLEPLKKTVDLLKKVPLVDKGIETLGEAGSKLKNIFVRPGLSGEGIDATVYKPAITQIENQLDFIADDQIRQARSLFKDLNGTERETVSRVMNQIQDTTTIAAKNQNIPLTDEALVKISSTILDGANLNPTQRSVIASLQQDYKTAAELEMRAGLLKGIHDNYVPRYYKALDDPATVSAYVRNKIGVSTSLDSSKLRTFETLADAEAAGFVPELDAMKVYATRMMTSRRALAAQQFKDSIFQAYGVTDLAKLPANIRDDVKLLGESIYPSGMNDGMKYFLQAFDYTQKLWKMSATVAKPSFAPKQLISNTVQAVMAQGVSALKILDPRTFMDTALVLSDLYRNKNTNTRLPEFLSNLFSKYSSAPDAVLAGRVAMSRIIGEDKLLDFSKDFVKRTVLGETLTGTELTLEMRSNGVIKGFDATGERFLQTIDQQLAYNPNSSKDLTKELLQYWKFPTIAEDYGRATIYINARGMGYSPKQAAEVVDKALFNYSRGLTSAEKNVAKRIIPFYTYQRFAIPFVLRNLVERPGNVSTGQKFVQLMEKLLVDDKDQLTPGEREIFGSSFLVEQPRVYTGFDNTGKAKFNVLNNMTPLDVFSLFSYDKATGELDLQRTAQKGVLAALTPYLKIPLESAINKQFFSGKAIEEAGKLGNLKDSIGYILPSFVKEAIGYEDRLNLRTGKTDTYINPYLAYYTLNNIPALKQFINLGDAGTPILDKAMALITGVVPSGIDLKEAQEWQALGDSRKLNELQGQVRMAVLRGSKNEYEKHLQEYQDFVKLVMKKNEIISSSTVRGQGINPTGQTTAQPELTQEQR